MKKLVLYARFAAFVHSIYDITDFILETVCIPCILHSIGSFEKHI